MLGINMLSLYYWWKSLAYCAVREHTYIVGTIYQYGMKKSLKKYIEKGFYTRKRSIIRDNFLLEKFTCVFGH